MVQLKLVINKNPLFDKCPECKEVATLHRSRARNIVESFIKRFTFFKIYRCTKCGWRGYRSTLAFTKASAKTLFFYILLAAVTAIVVRFVIAKFIK